MSTASTTSISSSRVRARISSISTRGASPQNRVLPRQRRHAADIIITRRPCTKQTRRGFPFIRESASPYFNGDHSALSDRPPTTLQTLGRDIRTFPSAEPHGMLRRTPSYPSFSPKARSPASPMPGTIYARDVSSASTAPTQSVVSFDGRCFVA